MSVSRLATTLLIAATLTAPALAATGTGSADAITHRQDNYDLTRQDLQHRVKISEMNAKDAEAKARIAEANARIAEAKRKENASPEQTDKKGTDPLANIDAKELRKKLGLPPSGPIVQKDEKQETQKQPAIPVDPSEFALPRLVSTTEHQASFMVANQRIDARPGDQINRRYRLKSISGDGVVIKSANGRTRRLSIDWSAAGSGTAGLGRGVTGEPGSQTPGMSTIR